MCETNTLASLKERRWRVRNTFLEICEVDLVVPPALRRSSSAGLLGSAMNLDIAEQELHAPEIESAEVRGRHSLVGKVDTSFSASPYEEVQAKPKKRGGGVRGANPNPFMGEDKVLKLALSQYCLPDPRSTKSEQDISEESNRFGYPVGTGMSHDVATTQAMHEMQVQHGSVAQWFNGAAPDTQAIGNAGEIEQEATTAMIRHIACRYTQEEIATFLDDAGFKEKYTSIYLPRNPQKTANLGYVFVSFLTPAYLEECRRLLDNTVFGSSQTTKRCQVTTAILQGPRRQQRRATRKMKNQKDLNEQTSSTEIPGQQDDLSFVGALFHGP
mmetsp:Transcript_109329/g.172287  ORF Transcript_109329/g.172287 Transcript_109329/m.172287 type:complete len:328 (+) Transcript_109329:45-1028(+)